MIAYRIGPETARLHHRALEVGDAEFFYELNSHPDVMRYTGEAPLPSVEAAADAIRAYPDFESVGYGRWACALRTTGELIGFCGLKYLPDLDEVDLGYRFLPRHWGRGYATEAGAASLAFGFETLGLERIVGFVLPENPASIRVLEKLGLRPVGEHVEDGRPVLKYEIRREAP